MVTMTYDGINAYTAHGVIVKSVNRPILPTLRRRELVVPGRDGDYDYGGNKFEKRFITVSLSFKDTSIANLRLKARSIASWLFNLSSQQLSFSDEPDKYYMAKIYDEVGLETLIRLGQSQITFECEPFAYAAYNAYDVTRQYDTGLQYNTGLIYPNPSGFTWAYAYQMSSLYNYGSVETDFKITITGTVTNPISITNVTTGKTISILTSLAAQTLVINSADYTVKKAGLNILPSVTGDFITLALGANKLVFQGINPIATVSYEWLNKFL